jgi:hypothetical protein
LRGFVVAFGDYYFDNMTRSIDKRLAKRKRGEYTRSKSSIERVSEWKVGPDPEEKIVQVAFTLNTFAGPNASSVLEVTNSIKIFKNKLFELEMELKYIKENLTIDVQKSTKSIESLNIEKMNIALQAQRDQMNAKF